MTITASPDTIRAVAEMFQLAALLDDRVTGADKGRIAAWSEQIERHHLRRGDLLDGLQTFYDQAHPHAIGIGDLIAHARSAKRDRLSREEDELREARQAENDAKAAEDIAAVSATAIIGRIKNRTPRLESAEAALQTCHGKTECMAAMSEYHAARREAAGKRPRKASA